MAFSTGWNHTLLIAPAQPDDLKTSCVVFVSMIHINLPRLLSLSLILSSISWKHLYSFISVKLVDNIMNFNRDFKIIDNCLVAFGIVSFFDNISGSPIFLLVIIISTFVMLSDRFRILHYCEK